MFPDLKELVEIQKNKTGYSELMDLRQREKIQGFKLVEVVKVYAGADDLEAFWSFNPRIRDIVNL